MDFWDRDKLLNGEWFVFSKMWNPFSHKQIANVLFNEIVRNQFELWIRALLFISIYPTLFELFYSFMLNQKICAVKNGAERSILDFALCLKEYRLRAINVLVKFKLTSQSIHNFQLFNSHLNLYSHARWRDWKPSLQNQHRSKFTDFAITQPICSFVRSLTSGLVSIIPKNRLYDACAVVDPKLVITACMLVSDDRARNHHLWDQPLISEHK